MNQLTRNILSAAKRGAVDLTQIKTGEDIALAYRFAGGQFREAIRGESDKDILAAIAKIVARGPRKFRSGVGLWLTDAEFDA